MTGTNKQKKTPTCKWLDPTNYSYGEDSSVNYGIPTGEGNDITVIDLDFHKLSEDQLLNNSFNQKFPHLEDWCELIVKTGSGGTHLYYQYDKEIKQSTNEELAIDVRNDGGYVVAGGSILDANTKYTIIKDNSPKPMPLMMKEWFQEIYYKKIKKKPFDRWGEVTSCINKYRLRSQSEYFKFLAAGYNLKINYDRIDGYLNDPAAGNYNKSQNLCHWEQIKQRTDKKSRAGWRTLEKMAEEDNSIQFAIYKDKVPANTSGNVLKSKDCDEAVIILEKTYSTTVVLGEHEIYVLTPKKQLIGHLSQKEKFEGHLGLLIRKIDFQSLDLEGNLRSCWTSYEARRNLVKTWIETILNCREVSNIEEETYEQERKTMQFSNGCWDFEKKEWLEGVFMNHFGNDGGVFEKPGEGLQPTVRRRLLDPILGDLDDYFLNWIARGLAKRVEDKTFGFAIGLRDSGKCLLCNALTKAFGGIQRFNGDCLLSKGNEGFQPKDLGFLLAASSAGIALGSEPSSGKFKALDGEVLKSIVGGETLLGRELFGKPVKFCFRGRLLMCANTPPLISTKDSGEKVVQFPFLRKFGSKEVMDANPGTNYLLADNTIHDFIKSKECIDALRMIVLKSFGEIPPLPECILEEIEMMAEDSNETEDEIVMSQILPCPGGKVWTSEILERLGGDDLSGRTVNAIMKFHGYKYKKIQKNGVRKFGFIDCELTPTEEEVKCMVKV